MDAILDDVQNTTDAKNIYKWAQKANDFVSACCIKSTKLRLQSYFIRERIYFTFIST